MTDTDTGPENAQAEEDAGAEDASRPQRFDKRIEEWILGLRDQAEEHTPEVLDGLAATAKSVAVAEGRNPAAADARHRLSSRGQR